VLDIATFLAPAPPARSGDSSWLLLSAVSSRIPRPLSAWHPFFCAKLHLRSHARSLSFFSPLLFRHLRTLKPTNSRLHCNKERVKELKTATTTSFARYFGSRTALNLRFLVTAPERRGQGSPPYHLVFYFQRTLY
jgi:hypothetical protein